MSIWYEGECGHSVEIGTPCDICREEANDAELARLHSALETARGALKDLQHWSEIAADMLSDLGHPTNGTAILKTDEAIAAIDAVLQGSLGEKV